MAYETKEAALNDARKNGWLPGSNRSTRARNATRSSQASTTGGSIANFYGPDPTNHLIEIAKGPAQHRLAVMPHNINAQAKNGCYAGMQLLKNRTGVDPGEILYPTPEQAAEAELVADELEARMPDVEKFYGSVERVTGFDAKTYYHGSKAQIARLKGTGQQIKTAASVTTAGFVQATQNAQVARKVDGVKRYHNTYRNGIDQMVTQRIAAARVG